MTLRRAELLVILVASAVGSSFRESCAAMSDSKTEHAITLWCSLVYEVLLVRQGKLSNFKVAALERRYCARKACGVSCSQVSVENSDSGTKNIVDLRADHWAQWNVVSHRSYLVLSDQ